MPGRGGKLPRIIERMAIAIFVENRNKGITPTQALKIAVKRCQELGYVKKGTFELTEKGRKWLAKKGKEKAQMDTRKFKELLRQDKKRNKDKEKK